MVTVEGIIGRAEGLDVGGEFELPPGDPISHFGAGMATVLAANVFLGGLDVDFAAEHVGYFTAPYALRTHVVGIDLDHEARSVSVRLDNGVTRTARIFGDQGAIAIPLGADDISFEPCLVSKENVGPGDLTIAGSFADEVMAAIDLAFTDEAMTGALVVAHRGEIVGERYRAGIDVDTPLEGWSMGKSVTATLLGRLVHEGVYDLDQPAPIPEWQIEPGDPRAEIRIRDILQMSSGLRFRAMADPGYDPDLGYPDHLYVYTGGINAFEYAANKPPQWPPGQVGRYRNGDPVLGNYLVRLGVEGRGDHYHSFPQRELFDPLGIATMTLETDPFGNFLLQGYEFACGRDWARLGNLYLNDGVVGGRRLLPEGYVETISTLAPGWEADGRPIYGGFFWLNGDGGLAVPRNSYFMAGAGGQRTIVIPDHELVVSRLGHFSGDLPGAKALNHCLEALTKLF